MFEDSRVINLRPTSADPQQVEDRASLDFHFRTRLFRSTLNTFSEYLETEVQSVTTCYDEDRSRLERLQDCLQEPKGLRRLKEIEPEMFDFVVSVFEHKGIPLPPWEYISDYFDDPYHYEEMCRKYNPILHALQDASQDYGPKKYDQLFMAFVLRFSTFVGEVKGYAEELAEFAEHCKPEQAELVRLLGEHLQHFLELVSVKEDVPLPQQVFQLSSRTVIRLPGVIDRVDDLVQATRPKEPDPKPVVESPSATRPEVATASAPESQSDDAKQAVSSTSQPVHTGRALSNQLEFDKSTRALAWQILEWDALHRRLQQLNACGSEDDAQGLSDQRKAVSAVVSTLLDEVASHDDEKIEEAINALLSTLAPLSTRSRLWRGRARIQGGIAQHREAGFEKRRTDLQSLPLDESDRAKLAAYTMENHVRTSDFNFVLEAVKKLSFSEQLKASLLRRFPELFEHGREAHSVLVQAERNRTKVATAAGTKELADTILEHHPDWLCAEGDALSAYVTRLTEIIHRSRAQGDRALSPQDTPEYFATSAGLDLIQDDLDAARATSLELLSNQLAGVGLAAEFVDGVTAEIDRKAYTQPQIDQIGEFLRNMCTQVDNPTHIGDILRPNRNLLFLPIRDGHQECARYVRLLGQAVNRTRKTAFPDGRYSIANGDNARRYYSSVTALQHLIDDVIRDLQAMSSGKKVKLSVTEEIRRGLDLEKWGDPDLVIALVLHGSRRGTKRGNSGYQPRHTARTNALHHLDHKKRQGDDKEVRRTLERLIDIGVYLTKGSGEEYPITLNPSSSSVSDEFAGLRRLLAYVLDEEFNRHPFDLE